MTAPNLHRVTRLAPSPTGALHLGNARTFLVNWLLARRNNWKIILRIEDIDGPRIKRNADQQLITDLRWLGLDWDEGPIHQLPRLDLYRHAIDRLLASRHAYPCICSRREVESAASAPHAEDGAAVYPGTCRNRFASIAEAHTAANRPPAIRFAAPDQTIEFTDIFKLPDTPSLLPSPRHNCRACFSTPALLSPSPGTPGEGRVRALPPHRYNVARQLGDFVIAKSDGTPAYQLAVVVDDADMHVTDIVRGDDLLDSTPRQILLYHALNLSEKIPYYYHLPLVIGADGRRLAKRHGDTRLAFYRTLGVPASRLLALLARWCNIPLTSPPTSAHDLLPHFRLDNLPRDPIVFQPSDDAWLRLESNHA